MPNAFVWFVWFVDLQCRFAAALASALEICDQC
jgi:hypothetical protein